MTCIYLKIKEKRICSCGKKKKDILLQRYWIDNYRESMFEM